MTSTRDPILLLEPSNLLEPLNLADRYAELENSSGRDDRDATSSKRFRRPTSAPIERDSQRDSRWRLKSALLVAGAFACVAAGAALPQLPELAFGDAKPAQQRTSAQQTVADATQQTIADATKQPVRIARPPANPEQSKPAESKANEPVSNGSNQSIALTENPGARNPAQSPAADQSAPTAPSAQDAAASGATSCGPRARPGDDKCLEGGVADPAAGTMRAATPDRNSPSAARAETNSGNGARAETPAPRTTGASTAKPPVATQAIRETDGRTQYSVNRRATQRDTADEPAAVDNNNQSANGQSAKSSDRSRRRERSAEDNGQTARYGNSRQEQDFNRNSGGRRDRYDEYARGEDRRVFGRAPREDDRVIGSGPPRHEGSMPIFPSLFGW